MNNFDIVEPRKKVDLFSAAMKGAKAIDNPVLLSAYSASNILKFQNDIDFEIYLGPRQTSKNNAPQVKIVYSIEYEEHAPSRLVALNKYFGECRIESYLVYLNTEELHVNIYTLAEVYRLLYINASFPTMME